MVAAVDLGEDIRRGDAAAQALGDDEIVDSPPHVPLSCGGAVAPPGVGIGLIGIKISERIGKAGLQKLGELAALFVGEAGIANDYSIKGNLLGHLYMGALKIDSVAKQLGVDEEKSLLVQHMLISHHGDPEFGAAVRPMFIEAEVLSQLDCLDATIYEMGSAIAGVNAGEFTGRQWALDNRKLYNHGLEDTTPKAKLI